MRIRNVITGWAKAWGLVPVELAEQKMKDLRLQICSDCPEHKVSKVLEFFGNEADYVDVIYCTKCKCPCSKKAIVAAESCPLNKW